MVGWPGPEHDQNMVPSQGRCAQSCLSEAKGAGRILARGSPWRALHLRLPWQTSGTKAPGQRQLLGQYHLGSVVGARMGTDEEESQGDSNKRLVPLIGRCFGISKHTFFPYSQFSSVAQSCLTPCDLMNHSMPGLPVHHQFPESTQTHVH